MRGPYAMVTIPLRDEELISLLRDEPLTLVIRSLTAADPKFRVRDHGPFLEGGGLRLSRKSWPHALRLLALDGQPPEFQRVAAAIRAEAVARGWM